MKGKHIRIIILTGAIVIIGIITIQVFWIFRAWNLNEQRLNNAIINALKNVAVKVSKYNKTTLPDQHPVRQLSDSYYIVNVNSQVGSDVLDYYIKSEFDLWNLKLDYLYGIYDCHIDSIKHNKFIIHSNKKYPKFYDLLYKLNKYDDFIYYFGIYFPSRKSFVFNQMTIWSFFSSLLLIIIIFFSYTLIIIFRQRKLSEMQKDFINNMTHEFKTPISTINIASDVLLTSGILKNPDRLKNYASIIKQENTRLNDQVEKVLQFARIERRGFSIKKEQIDLHELIKIIVQSNEIKRVKKNVKIKKELHAENCIIEADKIHLTNIIFSLIDNAIKYSSDDVSITIMTQTTEKHTIFSVKDNGIGIPEEFHKKIFFRFYRIPTGNIHNVKGFGLGLFYVKKVCDEHGWKIQLVSKPQEGSHFKIYIPTKVIPKIIRVVKRINKLFFGIHSNQ